MRSAVMAGLALTGAAMLLAGCGGSDGSASSPPTGTLITTTPTPSIVTPPASPSATTTAPAPVTTTGAPTSTGTAPPAGPPQCYTSQLSASLGQGSSGAGTQSAPLVLTNTSPTACTVNGYPGVSYVNGDAGDQVGNAAARTGPDGTVVVLAPGASASSLVLFTQVFNYPENICQPVPVRGIRVYPPNNTDALYVPRPDTGCASTAPDVSQLKVQALTTGATGGL